MAFMAGQLALYAFLLLMLLAATLDVLSLHIPNWIVIALAMLFFPIAFITGMPGVALGLHTATAVVLLIAGYGLFSFGMIGGGDAKLMSVAGLWLGFPVVLPFLLFAAIAGGILAVAIGLWAVVSLEARIRGDRLERAVTRLSPDLPYGFALAAGVILAVPFSRWMAFVV